MNHAGSIDYQLSATICNAALKGFSDRQQELIDFILQTHETTDGFESSNYNGWHLGRNLRRPIGAEDAQPKVEVNL